VFLSNIIFFQKYLSLPLTIVACVVLLVIFPLFRIFIFLRLAIIPILFVDVVLLITFLIFFSSNSRLAVFSTFVDILLFFSSFDLTVFIGVSVFNNLFVLYF